MITSTQIIHEEQYQISIEEQYQNSIPRKAGHPQCEVAQMLGRHKSTISRGLGAIVD